MVTRLKQSIGALSVVALLSSTLPTVIAETVPSTVQILDNASTTGFTKTGTWYTASDSASYAGNYLYTFSGPSTTKAVWTFTNLTPGQYKVSVTYRPKSYFSTKAEFRVFDGGVTGKDLGVTTVNETIRASSGDIDGTPWQTLGTPGGHFAVLMNSLSVTLSANASAWVQADAVRIERIGELTDVEQMSYAREYSLINNASAPEGEDTTSTINVLTVVTQEAIDLYDGDTKNLTESIIRFFDCNPNTDSYCQRILGNPLSVNAIMKASGVRAKFQIVGFHKIGSVMNNNIRKINADAAANEEIDTIRRNTNADIVVVFTGPVTIENNINNILGTSFGAVYPKGNLDTIIGSNNPWNYTSQSMIAESAFVSIHLNHKYDGVTVLTHEIGHILGSGHEVNAGDGAEKSAHALIIDGVIQTIDTATRDQDVGSATCPKGCPAVPIFSNPNLSIRLSPEGAPIILGIPDVADNVRTMNKVAPLVAQYHTRPSLSFFNKDNCFDKDNDGFVTPRDALVVINYLNSSLEKELSKLTEKRKVFFEKGLVDTNNDGWIAPNDALKVINYINNPTNPAFSPETVCPH